MDLDSSVGRPARHSSGTIRLPAPSCPLRPELLTVLCGSQSQETHSLLPDLSHMGLFLSPWAFEKADTSQLNISSLWLRQEVSLSFLPFEHFISSSPRLRMHAREGEDGKEVVPTLKGPSVPQRRQK